MTIPHYCVTSIISRHLIIGLVVFIPLVSINTSHAADNEWHFELTPYIWATSQKGDVALDQGPGSGVTIDQNFSDILQRLDLGGMATFEARKERWGFMLDALYLKVSDSDSFSGPNNVLTLSADGDVTQKLFSAAGYYRVTEGKTNVDALLGIRYHVIDWDVNARLSTPIGDISQNFSQRKSWADPYIGVRVQHALTDSWSLMGYGDIGGSGTDISWQTLTGVNYAFRQNLIGKFGYRFIHYDYHRDGFKYNVDTSGFYVGLGFSW